MIPVSRLGVVPFGCFSGPQNMALDLRLLNLCDEDPANGFLRFYGWDPPALSLGHFEPAETIEAAAAARRGIQVVRRPTGGRVVLHRGDLTYSLVIPRQAGGAAEVYAWVSQCIAEGLRSLGASVDFARGTPGKSAGRIRPCFLSASRHEIVSEGRKLVGSAQRLSRRALLQHGSIPVDEGYLGVIDYLRCADREKAALRDRMAATTTCLTRILGRPVAPREVAASLCGAFVDRFGCRVWHLTPQACLSTENFPQARLTP
jgi:lipoate-protein ligase A